MGYLNKDKKIEINNKIYNLKYSLKIIDELQTRSNMAITELLTALTHNKTREASVKLIMKLMTGVDITDNYNFYSMLLLETYIEQLKLKKIDENESNKTSSTSTSTEYEYMNIEYWFYIAKVVLGYPEEEAWNLTIGKIGTLHREHLKYHGVIKDEATIDDVIPSF